MLHLTNVSVVNEQFYQFAKGRREKRLKLAISEVVEVEFLVVTVMKGALERVKEPLTGKEHPAT